MRPLPPDSVRGRIAAYIERHAERLGADVLECGARLPQAKCSWASARHLARGAWTGTDMQAGLNVDVVADLHALPKEWSGRFSGILLSEVLEHVRWPQRALRELHRALQPGGALIVTTLTAFPIHNYPSDYRRWTEAGLHAELEDAGFVEIKTERAGAVDFALNDHGESGLTHLTCPIHVFAIATTPRAC